MRRRIRIDRREARTRKVLLIPCNRRRIDVTSMEPFGRNKLHELGENSSASAAPIQNIAGLENRFVFSDTCHDQGGNLHCRVDVVLAPPNPLLKMHGRLRCIVKFVLVSEKIRPERTQSQVIRCVWCNPHDSIGIDFDSPWDWRCDLLEQPQTNSSIITASPPEPKLAPRSSTTSRPSITAPDCIPVLPSKARWNLNPNSTN